jgi:hypothetical protein
MPIAEPFGGIAQGNVVLLHHKIRAPPARAGREGVVLRCTRDGTNASNKSWKKRIKNLAGRKWICISP